MEEKETINITLKIEKSQLTNFEYWLKNNLELISFKVLPNTEKLYNENDTFKKLVKSVNKAQKERDKFINNDKQIGRAHV